eukprot:maker-scaffold192_size271026-snap-gene-1.17 protein:Tk07201 transcript:maker-scaffold192_size271026-snap-gene-1.17-mRNA-1 annotation:"probable atp-dependent rna helicase pitchoune"
MWAPNQLSLARQHGEAQQRGGSCGSCRHPSGLILPPALNTMALPDQILKRKLQKKEKQKLKVLQQRAAEAQQPAEADEAEAATPTEAGSKRKLRAEVVDEAARPAAGTPPRKKQAPGLKAAQRDVTTIEAPEPTPEEAMRKSVWGLSDEHEWQGWNWVWALTVLGVPP